MQGFSADMQAALSQRFGLALRLYPTTLVQVWLCLQPPIPHWQLGAEQAAVPTVLVSLREQLVQHGGLIQVRPAAAAAPVRGQACVWGVGVVVGVCLFVGRLAFSALQPSSTCSIASRHS